jgi:thioredoxin-like negative regulator of GroEL
MATTTYRDRIDNLIAERGVNQDLLYALLRERRATSRTQAAKLIDQAHDLLRHLVATDPEVIAIRKQLGQCLIDLNNLDG